MRGYEIVAYLDVELFEKMKKQFNSFMSEVHKERNEHHVEFFQYDISRVSNLCNHLSLKEGYRLFCKFLRSVFKYKYKWWSCHRLSRLFQDICTNR